MELPYKPVILFLGIYLEQTKILIWQDYMHTNSHNGTIYSCQDMEATWVSINRWMDKEDVVYLFNAILLNHKKRMEYCHLQ